MNVRSGHRLLLVIVGFLLAVCFGALVSWIHFLSTPLINRDEGVHYSVAEGTSLRAVIHDLYLLDIIKHPLFFRLLAYLRHDQHLLKSGEYFFPKGTRPSGLLTQITTGSGMVYHGFTIVAGWSFHHLRHALNRHADLKHVSASLSDQQIMERLGAPPGMSPEGWFFPDTYLFVKGTSDLVVLGKAYQSMQKNLASAWADRESGLPFANSYEALTAASLIEKETGINHERAMIAGVIVNRLNKNMLLQIDPTVIYAAGSHFSGTIHRKDLLRKSPWNTYVTKGLPPTPIAMPAMESITAVMHPVHHNYYYYVAGNYDMSGSHRFSTTLKEHYAAVARAKRRHSHTEYFNNALMRYYFSRAVLPDIYN